MTNTPNDTKRAAPQRNAPARKPRIAILGGGLGGLSAAYELTGQPGWQDRYEVTVYQKGWRLGGKGASGRGDDHRIEEHGLHCFWGFYDNAFAMLRACYGEIDRQDGPIKTVDDAFKKLSSVLFIDQVKGRWCRYEMRFPDNGERPGEGPRATEMNVRQLFERYIRQLRDEVLKHVPLAAAFERAVGGDLERKLTWLADVWKDAEAWIPGSKSNGPSNPYDDARQLLAQLQATTHADVQARGLSNAPGIGLERSAEKGLLAAPLDKSLDADDPDAAYRRRVIFEAMQFGFFMLGGILADGVPSSLEGFDADTYDARDLRKWLQEHNAPAAVIDSQIVTGLYNASFCYPQGDFRVGDLAAGVSLRTVLLMGFTYKGSFMWKMQASMGDVVFAPLYEALEQRGVTFELFHDVKALSLAPPSGALAGAGPRAIESIVLERQAVPKAGRYAPLIDVGGLPSWPARPRYELLENGEALRDVDLESDWHVPTGTERTLRRGQDGDDGFDHVILAIPLLALTSICRELTDSTPRWKRMVEGIKTIRTKSFQLWFKPTDAQRKWQTAHRVMTDVYKNDFNSVADMSQTLPFESWPADRQPGSVVYFSTAMADDPDEPKRGTPAARYQEMQDELVADQAHAWLTEWQSGIFPFLGNAYDPADYVSEFHRANVNADQRYTLSVAGSAKFRLAPDGSGFRNLFLAGDWTKSPLNLGCAEGATMSGLLAARGALAALDALAAPPARVAPAASITPVARVTPSAPVAHAAARATFVDYPGMPVYPPPYRQKDLTLCQFVLEADTQKMQEVVDRYLNVTNAPHRFAVLGSWVLFQTGHVGSNISGVAGAMFGTGQETSATFLVPVVRWGGDGLIPIEIGLFAPFVFVDHPLSLIAGREVLGMAKQLASFLPLGGGQGGPAADLDNMTIETMVVEKLGPTSPVVMRPIVRITRPQRKRTLARPQSAFEEVTAAMADVIGSVLPLDGDPVRNLLERLLAPRKVAFFSLRQLRDLRDPSAASVQELTRGVMHLGEVDLRRLAGGHTIEIMEYGSHRIAEMLGLATGLIAPLAAVRINIDEATLASEP